MGYEPNFLVQSLGGAGPPQQAQPQGAQAINPFLAQLEELKRRQEAAKASRGPMYSPDEVADRQWANDRDYQLGMLAQIAGGEGAQQVGGLVLKQALAARQPRVTERGVADPLTGQFKYSQEYLDQRDDAERAAVEGKHSAWEGQNILARTAAAERAAAQQQADARDAAMRRDQRAWQESQNALNRDAIRGRQGDATDMRRQQADDRETAALSAKAAELVPLRNAVASVQAMLTGYGDKPIPGVGYDSALPGVLLSKQGNVNRSQVQRVANSLLRAQSGQAVSLSEAARSAAETMANGRFSEEEFRTGWPFIVESMNANLQNLRAGYRPEIVQTYTQRGGNLANVPGAVERQGGATGGWGPAAPAGAGGAAPPAGGGWSATIEKPGK